MTKRMAQGVAALAVGAAIVVTVPGVASAGPEPYRKIGLYGDQQTCLTVGRGGDGIQWDDYRCNRALGGYELWVTGDGS